MLTRLHGTLWISQDDHAWVKADMETTDGVKWAFFKLHEGAILRFTQRHLNDEVWLPDSWYVRLRAKAALVFNFNGEFSGSYRDYKRFTADSTVVEQGIAP